MGSHVPKIGYILLGVALVLWLFLTALPRPVVVQAVATTGQEHPEEGALLENGWLIKNHGDASMHDVYLRYQSFLGEPLAGFDGQRQAFRFGRLVYQPSNPQDWKVEFDNLGWLDMQVAGYTPRPGQTPHPALRDWLLTELEAGWDMPRLVGRIISEPKCDKRTRQCVQWTDKQRFHFAEGALTAAEVQRQPLGLWLTHPSTREQKMIVPEQAWWERSGFVLLAALLFVLVGFLIWRPRRGGQRMAL